MSVSAFRNAVLEREFKESGLPDRPLVKKAFYLNARLDRRMADLQPEYEKKYRAAKAVETGQPVNPYVFAPMQRRELAALYQVFPDMPDEVALALLFSNYRQYRETLATQGVVPMGGWKPFMVDYVAAVEKLDARIAASAIDIYAFDDNATGRIGNVVAFMAYSNLRSSFDNALNMVQHRNSFSNIESLDKSLAEFKARPLHGFTGRLADMRIELLEAMDLKMPDLRAFWLTERLDVDEDTPEGWQIKGAKQALDFIFGDNDGDGPLPPSPKPH
ncbi:MAG: hypothetical protein KGQ41_02385 [Alphaproteobacteria bacterium]|nr:hypothetical protein [Alphaproteobacteria bacterium]